MSRSLTYLRRGLLGLAVTGSLGFGATQAFARPDQAMGNCPNEGYDYYYEPCKSGCPRPWLGAYCSTGGWCVCGDVP